MNAEERQKRIDAAIDDLFEAVDEAEGGKITADKMAEIGGVIMTVIKVWDVLLPIITQDIVNAVATAKANVHINTPE